MPHTVTDHLLDRLAELGVDRLFGVPGDFTLAMLDHVEAHERVAWTGCANELGAGYAADGYARMRGLGAICTTFGVGELSAINAIAGAYAEHVPVVHIVGAPATATIAAARATHHSLGDGDFGHFARMTAEVTCAQAFLNAEDATDRIDHVLLETVERRQPGYIVLPADVAQLETSPASAPLAAHPGITNASVLAAFRVAAGRLLAPGASVAVLADILVHRMGAIERLHELVAAGRLPHATLLWGRRVVDESAPGYLGTYVGAVSAEPVRAAIEDSDVVVLAGVQFTDLTSGFFSQRLADERTIAVDPHEVRVGTQTFSPIAMADALAVLADLVRERAASRVATGDGTAGAVERDGPGTAGSDGPGTVGSDGPGTAGSDGSGTAGSDGSGTAGTVREPAAVAVAGSPHPVPGVETGERPDPHAPLGQAALWDAIAARLRPGDLVLADQGTSFYGMGAHRLPHDVVFVGQPLWASIGYTLPALLGASLAAPERRPIVLIGDGAAQLTIGELGTLARNRVPAIVVVVNNDGYTVERAIHGPEAAYNDIARWDWAALVDALAPTGQARGVRAATLGELETALDEADPARLTLVEAVVPRLDVPPLLRALAAAAAAANRSPR